MSIDDPQMPNGCCNCPNLPFHHLDCNGHVPTCANWDWSTLWQERLAHNIAIGAALCRAYNEGADECGWWTPGCGQEMWSEP